MPGGSPNMGGSLYFLHHFSPHFWLGIQDLQHTGLCHGRALPSCTQHTGTVHRSIQMQVHQNAAHKTAVQKPALRVITRGISGEVSLGIHG
jgi:hypothetical protein